MPILTSQGCNSGPCHGKARGQNGFQLSLLGFDADFDYTAITQQARGRRIFPAVPQQSLLLRKAAALAPHGGGQRISIDSPDYQLLKKWIAQGTPRRRLNEPQLTRVQVTPSQSQLEAGQAVQLVVTASYSDGSQRDVTARSSFQSNEPGIVAVNDQGAVQAGTLAGEAAIMVRYMNSIEVSRVLIPQATKVLPENYAKLPVANFVDQLVWDKLQTLRVLPSMPASDATFLRRVHIDLIGRLPTPAESRRFLESQAPDKRSLLIDELLARPEYADHWANKWADLLRPNPYRVGIKAVLNYDNWIREQFRQNVPYDEFVTRLLTAEGTTWHNGAVTLFRDRRSPDELASMVSQLFLGIRLGMCQVSSPPL